MDKNQIQKVRNEVKEYKDRTGKSYNQISKLLLGQYSSSSISLFAAGKYEGNEASIASNLQKLLDEEKQQFSQPSMTHQIVQTETMRNLWKVGRYSKNRKKLCVVTGKPGTGKSVATLAFARKYGGVILIEAVPTISPKELMLLLHEELKLSTSGSIHSMFKEVERKLVDSNTILIVDEAENLPKKCLELVRRLWDLTSIGVLLVGTNMLIQNLRGRKGEFAQLYSRIGLAYEVEVIGEKDAQAIIDANLPGMNGLWRVIYSHSKKNARHLGNLLDAIRVLAEDGNKITEDLIEEAATTLIIS